MTIAAKKQQMFFDMCPIDAAIAAMANSSEDDRGAIFTRLEVVEFILDLVGYTTRKKLFKKRLLEPSFGHGDFLLACIDRLLTSWQRFNGAPEELVDAIQGVELHTASFERTKQEAKSRLLDVGLGKREVSQILSTWFSNTDFLLWHPEAEFDFIVGNPPYIRIERIPDALMKEYRRLYATMFDRADLYIPFIEHSLHLLAPKGQLGFICADRWMKNKYGGPLRALIEKKFHLKFHVDMVGTPAFHSDVIAYPAVTVISRETPNATKVAERPEISAKALSKLSKQLSSEASAKGSGIKSVEQFANGTAPWLLSDCKALLLLRKLEKRFPLIEMAGCKIGIGVATGADKVYIGPFEQLDVEPCRKLRLATTKDIQTGRVDWRGLGVVNPFEDDGSLADFTKYPRLQAFFEEREDVLKRRHVAKKAPTRWYRTIDRIYPELADKEKLLVPDIKGNANFVFEAGKLYPHHNLYFITSEDWDLKALQVVLCSGIGQLFVSLYSPRMRGDYIRFQAQHLRRICIPAWSEVPTKLRKKLRHAWENGEASSRPDLIAALYQLSKAELATLNSIPTQGAVANAN